MASKYKKKDINHPAILHGRDNHHEHFVHSYEFKHPKCKQNDSCYYPLNFTLQTDFFTPKLSITVISILRPRKLLYYS
jgi:hypothetical protein